MYLATTYSKQLQTVIEGKYSLGLYVPEQTKMVNGSAGTFMSVRFQNAY
jgi:hypothetical protein